MSTLLSWSSGKDSAWALHRLRAVGVEVTGLFTTVTAHFDRVSMHGVRRELLEAQAAAVGLPVRCLELPWPCPDGAYEELMGAAVEDVLAEGATHMAFGDLFLEDVRDYRLARLAGTGLEARFPLWGLDTTRLARQMVDAGVRAYLTCLDPKRVPAEFAGAPYDHALLDALPEGVDPCAENGEFHTFAVDGPAFARAVEVEVGESVEREGFLFTDLSLREA